MKSEFMQNSEALMAIVRKSLHDAYEADWWADRTDRRLRMPFKELALKCQAVAIMKLSIVVRQQTETI